MDPNLQPQYPQQPQAPQQPQQPPQQPGGYPPQQQPQYPQQPGYQQQPAPQAQGQSNGPNIKKLLIIAGAFLGVITIIAVIASAAGGGTTSTTTSTALVAVDNEQLSFTISAPEGWSVTATPGTDLLNASAPEDDLSTMSAFISEDTVEAGAFEARIDAAIEEIESDLFTASTGLAISEVVKEQLPDVNAGTTYRIAFNAIDAEERNFRFETYETLLADGRVLTVSLQLTDQNTSIANSPQAILNSFSLR